MAPHRVRPFVLAAFGKQRRTLEVTEGSSTLLGSFCDPLVGVKFGVGFEVSPHFVVAPSVGVALNLDSGSRTSLFGEVELNRQFGNGVFIGAGVGVWDFCPAGGNV